LPRILLPGESDNGGEQDLKRIEDSITLIVNQAMRNHNRVFLTTFGNIMKVTFVGFPTDQLGPWYFNIPNTEMEQSPPAGSKTANNGNGTSSSAGAMVAQQPNGAKTGFSTTPQIPHSAQKMSSSAKKLVNNINYHVDNAIQAGYNPQPRVNPLGYQ
jgi:hypothetical protein